MGDIIDKVQENAQAEFMFARAIIVLKFEETLTKDQQENGKGDAWQGKLRALRKMMTDVKQRLSSDIDTLKIKLLESKSKREVAEKSLEAKFDTAEKLRKKAETQAAKSKEEERVESNRKHELLAQKTDRLEHMLTLICKHLGDLEKPHAEEVEEEDAETTAMVKPKRSLKKSRK
ncbi:hypothetical protein TrVE_jg2659 [Triparma verrucosa]|uniref:Uncharacterized protein n=1 Tax=Triparma verrucosa TaxID=1606542 RepID=A0A9W7B861_9STRA|nr:hypothetical protein TrVE_jg2659 [Triparma verrucosa]